MSGRSLIYLQLKGSLQKGSKQPILCRDILELSGPSEAVSKIHHHVFYPQGIEGPTTVTALEVIRLVTALVPEAQVQFIGPPSVLLSPQECGGKWRMPQVLKVLFTGLLLFVGSGLALLYFHADVNMHQAHQTIYKWITGEHTEMSALLAISYSIGIGLGIALFFDVFSLGRKKKTPGPLELELYQNERELEHYLMAADQQKPKP